MEDFDYALDRIKLGITKKGIKNKILSNID